MMPKIARKTLGLKDGTFSRVAIEHHGLVFQGEGITKPVSTPVSMLGTYTSAMLNNLFVYMKNNHHNGMLGVTTGPLTKIVFFKRGDIVFAGSTDVHERIGSYFVRHGFMTQEQVDEIAANEDPRRFGVQCKEAGYITSEQMWEALRTQIVSICCSLVEFPVGFYFFMPNSVPGDSFSHFKFVPNQILFEGVLRLDERERAHGIDHNAIDERSPLEVLSAMEHFGDE